MKSQTLTLLVLVFLCAPSTARADDDPACDAAWESAQRLKKSEHLLEAKQQLAICKRDTCAPSIAKECNDIALEVEGQIPSVIFAAHHAGGGDILDVTVTNAGTTLTTRLDAKPIPLDPGTYTFRFTIVGGASRDVPVLLKPGEKTRIVDAEFEALPPPQTPAAPAIPPAETTERRDAPNPSGEPARPAGTEEPRRAASSSALRTIGWAALGLGAIGMGIGSIYGLTAISKNNTAHCDASSVCDDPQARRDAQSAATASTVGFALGAGLVACGVVALVLSPVSNVTVTPTAAANGGGVSLGGAWQ